MWYSTLTITTLKFGKQKPQYFFKNFYTEIRLLQGFLPYMELLKEMLPAVLDMKYDFHMQ